MTKIEALFCPVCDRVTQHEKRTKKPGKKAILADPIVKCQECGETGEDNLSRFWLG